MRYEAMQTQNININTYSHMCILCANANEWSEINAQKSMSIAYSKSKKIYITNVNHEHRFISMTNANFLYYCIRLTTVDLSVFLNQFITHHSHYAKKIAPFQSIRNIF